jgi:lipoate-protein ligase A
MLYIENESTDAAFNLAIEQHLFDILSVENDLFMFWRNSDAVIVGLHQNAAEEINGNFIRQNNIPVIRRLSGGGAVFHDLGNLNYTIISKASDYELDFRVSCRPVLDALKALGVDAVAGGRNDITVNGRKVSGNARYLRDGRLMHHGTILFDTNLEKMTEALRIPEDKFSSKGIKSARARVTNLREHLPKDMAVSEFMSLMRGHVASDMKTHTLSARDYDAIEALRAKRYGTWEWNYGRSPDYGVEKRRRIPGFGAVTVKMRIDGGVITGFAASGDYFGNRPGAGFGEALKNTRLEERALLDRLSEIPFEEYFEGLDRREFISLLLD